MSETSTFYTLTPPKRAEAPWKATQPENGGKVDTILTKLGPLRLAAANSLAMTLIRKYIPSEDRSPELVNERDEVSPFPGLPSGNCVLSEQSLYVASRLQYAQVPPEGGKVIGWQELIWMAETAPDVFAEGERVFNDLNPPESKAKDDEKGNSKGEAT